MERISGDMVLDQDYDDKDVAIITPDDSTQMDDIESEPLLRADDFEAIKKRHMPELPDLEILDEVQNTWTIENWRQMPRKAHGPVFQCNGSPWRILFFPQGNQVDHTSLYLEQAFEDKAPEDWYVCAQFMLVLWNPNEPTIFVHHTAQHRFNTEEADWGFTRFAELRKLFAVRYEDRDRPMVENDEARITAYIRIYKDPTGVLWHNFNNYDSKKETGMVGLKNQGATCYLNSLLQSLYFTTAFRKAVYQIPTAEEVDFRNNSAYALQRLFYQMQTSNNAVPTLELTAAFGWDSRQIFEQQDVQELSRILMERLEERMKGTEAENALAKMFLGKTKTYLKCINVTYESSRIEDYWDIQLLVSGMKDVDASFAQYVEAERMDGDNKYQTETYGLQDAEKGVSFETFPSVLHLQLKRFEFDYQRDVMLKINDRHEFPEVWDAAPYLSADADKSEPYIYHLHGVLVHSGDLNAGHYYAFIKPEKNGDFYRYDDDKVTRATKKEAMDDNFGGEYPMSNGTMGMRNPYTRQWSAKRSTNAYMLVYIRESRIDEVLCTTEEVQPPEHLARKFAEERALLEKRRKEREEAHLYMEVQVATTANFKAHQGLDIVLFKQLVDGEEDALARLCKYPKGNTMAEFTTYIGQEYQIDPAMIRPWVMVNRQNGTVRPDTRKLSMDMTVEEAAIKHGTKSASFRLWLELATEKDAAGFPIFEDAQLEAQGTEPILLFLKYFDVEGQTLHGVGTFYAAPQDKVADVAPQILKLMNWPTGMSFKMFEEIKQGMIEPMKPKQTLHSSELQSGDIITVQKVLSEKEIAAVQASGHYSDAREFYEYLQNRVNVSFIPKFNQETPDSVFELTLSKKDSYNQFAKKVADKIGCEWTHLRFSPISNVNNRAKLPIKHNTAHNLGQILNPGYNAYNSAGQRNDSLFYEILEFSMAELEMKKTFKITWLPEGLLKEEHHEVLVPKNGTVYDIVKALQKRADITDEIADRIRVYEMHGFKIFRDCAPSTAVSNLSDYSSLIAEPTPEEELDALPEGDVIIGAFHFDREPTRPHNLPFSFLVKHGEVFKETRERISKRTGLKGKGFDKIKFAVVQRHGYQKPDYLEDDDILSEKLVNRDDMIGLDHPTKQRVVTKDQAISIKR